MDATNRIVEEFDRLIAIGHSQMPGRSLAERTVYFIVATRCEIDMVSFTSVYQQAFSELELSILIEGLRSIGEESLAMEFAEGLELLRKDGYYDHENWNRVSASVKPKLIEIGNRIGDRLWGLDEKLVGILDQDKTGRS